MEVTGRFFEAEATAEPLTPLAFKTAFSERGDESHKHQPASICLSAKERSSPCETASEKPGCAIAAQAFEEKE